MRVRFSTLRGDNIRDERHLMIGCMIRDGRHELRIYLHYLSAGNFERYVIRNDNNEPSVVLECSGLYLQRWFSREEARLALLRAADSGFFEGRMQPIERTA